MRAQELGEQLNREWLDKLYGFSYRRCRSSHEAEDLCADIVLALFKSLAGGQDIQNPEGFIWGVARRVYADFCARRKRETTCIILQPWDESIADDRGTEQPYLAAEEREQFRNILTEIAFLAKIYRDVMVMYYLEERKIRDIARALSISETSVKQRLFTARSTIRKEVDKMDTTITLKPVHLEFIGTGNPVGNDPGEKAERTLSQNLVYLCKNRAMSAKELSEALGVPMPYVEEEIDIQCQGANGSYGLLRRLDNGKVISNIVIFDQEEYRNASAAYRRHADALCELVARNFAACRDELLVFPFLHRQEDARFILWSLISGVSWALDGAVEARLKQRLADTAPVERPFSTMAFAAPQGREVDYGFYGCDGIIAQNVCGYRHVFVRNIYGRHIQYHFHCEHNIATDPQLMMTINAIGGLPVAGLTDEEQEVAAQAIACGYLQREGDQLFPKILVLDRKYESAFNHFSNRLAEGTDDLADAIAQELAIQMDKMLPAHLRCEYKMFNMGASTGMPDALVEACIGRGLLLVPDNPLCAEGVVMVVSR